MSERRPSSGPAGCFDVHIVNTYRADQQDSIAYEHDDSTDTNMTLLQRATIEWAQRENVWISTNNGIEGSGDNASPPAVTITISTPDAQWPDALERYLWEYGVFRPEPNSNPNCRFDVTIINTHPGDSVYSITFFHDDGSDVDMRALMAAAVAWAQREEVWISTTAGARNSNNSVLDDVEITIACADPQWDERMMSEFGL